MDDLNGLFSTPQPSVPQTPGVMPQNTSTFPMGMMETPQMQMMPNNNNNFQQNPNQMGQQPQMQVALGNMVPGQQQFMGQQQQQQPASSMMTPTQTTAASQLNNKTQILNQFQSPSPAVNQFGGMMPPRPAPAVPVQFQQQVGIIPQQQQQQIPQQNNFNDTFMSSVSVTEPGPVEFDDGLFGSPLKVGNTESSNDVTDSGDSGNPFSIDEQKSPEIIPNENKEEVAKPEEEKKEEVETDGEATPKTPKPGFWTGLWNRNKDHGSKENIIDESEKKDDEGRGGNEQKFVGDGQNFKGKLIGVLEVKEARGDRMCQDALQELKMAIKASGEHKQRVNIQIAVDGLKIRDEKTGDCLYHHPVHKISFIAQDMSDNRAFGYVYGSPENGHRFFGIKTEKAAGQVVVAMRDLFQVVFEMKKKEIDEAKQNMDSDLINDSSKTVATFPEVTAAAAAPMTATSAAVAAIKNNAIDDLLGLETELSNLQAGIQQIDKIAPSPPMSFQTDSMLPLSLSVPASQQQAQQHVSAAPRKPVAVMNQNPPVSEFGTAPFLPPPPSKVGRKPEAGGPVGPGGQGGQGGGQDRYAVFDSVERYAHNNNILQQQSSNSGFENAFFDEGSSNIFGQQPAGLSMPPSGPASLQTQNNGIFGTAAINPSPVQPQQQQMPQLQTSLGGAKSGSQDLASMFTDLDPLGTGTSKPFVDKKDFFNTPKKGLKMTGASNDSLNNTTEPVTMEDIGAEEMSMAQNNNNQLI